MDLKTINTYNQLAKEYDEETVDFWEHFPRTILNEFIKHTKGKVLNVGCGPGRDGLLIKDAGCDVICLDVSIEMVKLSKEKGLNSVVGDFNNLEFEDKSFDGVWAYTSLLHVPKSEICLPLLEIRRVLKDGGTFGLGLIEGEGELYKESSGVGKPRLFSFYRKEEIENLLTKHGFEILYFDEFKPRSKNYLNFICRKG